MFLRGGYRYLVEFVLGKMTHAEGLKQRVRLLVEKGDNLAITKTCEICGSAATHVIAHGSERYGYTFLPACRCAKHTDVGAKRTAVPIKFSSTKLFASRTDQWQFIQRLRWCCGIEDTRMTAKAAFEFFFPPENKKDDSPVSRSPQQLKLF